MGGILIPTGHNSSDAYEDSTWKIDINEYTEFF